MELIARPGAVPVAGNLEMLFRAIRNVLENAVRYSPTGGNVEVEIASGATVLIKDRGPGIHPADRPLVFQRFWRKNRQDREHSGLGLAIVARIVQLHGGAIEVLSREGGGTIFRIALPPAPL